MPVPYSKNKPQYAFLAAFLVALTLLVLVVGGPGWAVVFLLLLPFSAMAFAGFHRRRTP